MPTRIANRILFFFLAQFFFYISYAQEFGGNPGSVKWMQVNKPAARVIFPKGLDSIATDVANITQYLSEHTQNSIGTKQRKINIVLQSGTTISNGYVALGPYRSEFYLTPAQNNFSLGSIPWHKQLALHEYRHVQQVNNFNVGLSQVVGAIFGEQARDLANSLSVPNWFFEGDAVYNETNTSEQGRGRLAYFFNDYRSLWVAGKNYSWMKLRNGSLRDYVPDHYPLGYMLVAYGREKYGEAFWKNVTHDAAYFKGLFYPMQKAIQKYSGKSFGSFRSDALDYFKQTVGDDKALNIQSKHFIGDDEFPQLTEDGAIIYVHSSYKEIPSFMIRRENFLTRLRVRDISIDQQYSYRNHRLLYAAYRPHERWGWENYSEIRLINTYTGEQKTVTRRSKYFAPDISDDGKTIVAVDVQPGGKSTLHLLDDEGKLLRALPNEEKFFYTYPKFVGENQLVSAIRKPNGEMILALLNSTSGRIEHDWQFGYNVISFPFVDKDTVYISASFNGKDELLAVTLSDRKIFRVTVPQQQGIGVYQFSSSGENIAWTEFTAYGYRMRRNRKQNLVWKELDAKEYIGTAEAMAAETGIHFGRNKDADLLRDVPNSSITATKYPKSFRLLNFHSLRPLVDDPDYTFSLVSENVLNTMYTEAFFNYNRNEQSKQLGANVIYGGWYPQISAGYSYTFDRRGTYKSNLYYFDQSELRAGMNVPLNFANRKHYTRLNVGSDYIINQPTIKGIYKDTLGNRGYSYINGYITFSHQSQQARQHIYPRFAQSLVLNYRNAITRYEGKRFSANSSLYFPGFARTNNIVLNLAYSGRGKTDRVNFSNNFPFSRGYTAVHLYRMYKFAANYHLPLFYPDAGVGNIVYFLRVRANVFYDYTETHDFYTNGQKFLGLFRSTGTEIFFDTKWWNQLPVQFGVRYSRLLDRDLFGGRSPNWFEFVLPVNLVGR